MDDTVETQDKKEIAQAVAIAAISAVFVGMINLGIDEVKKAIARRDEVRKAAEKAKEAK